MALPEKLPAEERKLRVSAPEEETKSRRSDGREKPAHQERITDAPARGKGRKKLGDQHLSDLSKLRCKYNVDLLIFPIFPPRKGCQEQLNLHTPKK